VAPAIKGALKWDESLGFAHAGDKTIMNNISLNNWNVRRFFLNRAPKISLSPVS
jgi:hypothetical protein